MVKLVRLSLDKFLILLLTVVILISCNKKSDFKNDERSEYILNYFKRYSKIHRAIKDSIENWKSDSMYVAEAYIFYPYQVDSLIIFNKDSTRLTTVITCSSESIKNSDSESMREFGGAKIKGKWYFFFMATMVVPRKNYQDKIYEPLSFQKLSWIAHKHILGRLLKKEENGNFKLSKTFSENYITPLPYGSWEDKPKNIVDSMILAYMKKERKNKITWDEIARVQHSIDTSRKPLEPRRGAWGKILQEDLDYPKYPKEQ